MTSILSRQFAGLPDPSSSRSGSETASITSLKELVSQLYREQIKIQDLLVSLGYALRSLDNLNQFLELIPLIASRVTDTNGGVLFLLKPNGVLHLQQLYCEDGHLSASIRKGLEWVVHQFQLQNDTTPHSHHWSTELDQQMMSYWGDDLRTLGVGVVVGNQERGRLYIFSHTDSDSWTKNQKKLLQLVADQTAVAIANQELHRELQRRERLDRELEIGAEIQRKLLPRHCPHIQGLDLAARCQTANRVGGDYYDFIPANYDQWNGQDREQPIPLEQRCWSITIGDVMGKGVPAGLLMTMLRGMLRAEVLNGHTPERILQHLNHVMYRDLNNSNRFVTLFYSNYNPQTHTLFYSNAAHHPPLLWRAKTQGVDRLDTQGMLIGLDANTHYNSAHVHLEVGDTVMYYTDGITDAISPSGSRFEEGNLMREFQRSCGSLASSQEILDDLFAKVQQFTGCNHHDQDDITLIVFRITG
ncbi:MAG: PP2C family protein-serine/threonine phosphatase [Cyanobacteria bacterium LVE1205-1]|jgi:sigma-B regulation protein RsbU (phosphoserine phosphatase)